MDARGWNNDTLPQFRRSILHVYIFIEDVLNSSFMKNKYIILIICDL